MNKNLRYRAGKRKYLLTAVNVVVMLSLAGNGYPYEWRTLAIEPRVSVTESYDDNITYENANPIEDWITKLSLGLDVRHEGKRSALSVSGDVTRQIFAQERDFNNTSEDLKLNYVQDLTKYDRLSLSNSFTHAEEPRSFEDAFGRSNERYSYYSNQTAVNLIHDLTQQLRLTLKYLNALYDPSRSDLSNSYLNVPGFELGYAVRTTTIISFFYNYIRRSFSEPEANATTNSLALGLRQYLSAKTYADITAGVDLIESFSGQGYTKPEFTLGLTHELDERSQYNINFTKRYDTNSYTIDLLNSWRVSANYTRQLLERLNVTLSTFLGNAEYTGSSIEETTAGTSIGLNYQLKKDVFANVGYSYSQTDSTDADREYEKNVVFLGMTVKF